MAEKDLTPDQSIEKAAAQLKRCNIGAIGRQNVDYLTELARRAATMDSDMLQAALTRAARFYEDTRLEHGKGACHVYYDAALMVIEDMLMASGTPANKARAEAELRVQEKHFTLKNTLDLGQRR